MCKYCDPDNLEWISKNENIGISLDYQPWMILAYEMKDDNGILTYSDSSQNPLCGAEINFCPMCGRKLTVRDEAREDKTVKFTK